METISVSKMRKSIEACERSKAYIDGLKETLDAISSFQSDAPSECFIQPKSGLDAVIVISTDKGLCGAFNHDIIKAAEKFTGENSLVIPVGQTADNRFSDFDKVDRSFVNLSHAANIEKINALTDMLLKAYGNTVKTVSVIYGKLVTKAVTTVVTKKLLPLEPSKVEGQINRLEFDPSPEVVLGGLLPLYISGMIYGAILDSAAAEHSARRAAMSASTKNADAMIDELSLEYSRARQSSVTNQITEIIGSRQAQAQSKKGDRR